MTAFVMIPYRDYLLEIYSNTIRPAITQAGLESVLAKDLPFVGSVTEEMVRAIRESKICIADLTETNPNVMYEVALAHSCNRPVILITQDSTDTIPFDIRHHRVIKYTATEQGRDLLFHELIRTLQATLEFGVSPTSLLKQMLVPSSLTTQEGPYVVAASPLSYREAYRSRGGWKDRPLGTYADHIGIRGLMQAFGLIFGLDRLPELLDPDDFEDAALEASGHFYLIASPKSNRLTGLLMHQFFHRRTPKWDFRPDPESTDLRNPMLSLNIEGRLYEPVNRVSGNRLVWDYGLVIRGPHPSDPAYMFMVLAGRSSRGTEASCLAATDPDCLQKLYRCLKDERVNLDDHRQAFCAVVSICARTKDAVIGPDQRLSPDKDTFRVENLVVYR